MDTSARYKQIITELIHKQIIILGPDITLARVKNIEGLQISSTGEVVSITGDPELIIQSIINRFVDLSGMIVRRTMESIVSTYQRISGLQDKKISSTVISPPPYVPPEQSHNQAPQEHIDQATQMKDLNSLIGKINEEKTRDEKLETRN